MKRSEDGEFELILGNRQLLSVFFIVVVLLGVFFTMGYIVGKNVGGPEVAAKRDPIVVDPTNPAAKPPEPAVNPLTPKPVPEQAAKMPVVTEKKAEEKKPEPKKPEVKAPEPKKEIAKKETPKPVAPPKQDPAPAPVASNGKGPALLPNGIPSKGQSFLQVVASSRSDCDFVADTLRKRGFLATVVPSENGGIFRVLVGPVDSAETISKTRGELEKAGFQSPFVKKY
ncbi:MAG: SPOR domain-containing protein [Candidatus Solibacter usitatus]|nr:SPOR domain-containing protein [Candidatus Solibacter usitatus]